ncbi:MAG: hypothetical protein K6E87_03560, partial [bacterium]|nr:hypothetical protein [bacterium]
MASYKKLIKIILALVVVAALVTLLIFNINNYINSTKRLFDLKDITNLKNYFENYISKKQGIYSNIEEGIKTKLNAFITFFKNFNIQTNFKTFLSAFFNGLYTFLMIALNIGLNAVILGMFLIKNTLDGKCEKIKYSKFALIYIKACKCLDKAKKRIFSLFKKLIGLIKKNKRNIFFLILLISISTGFLYKFLIELLLFIVSYFYHVFNLESQVVIISFIKYLAVVLYPVIINIPSFVWIIFIIVFLYFDAILRAKLRLKKNHQKLKDFAKDELTQTTFINGAPGTGKTLLNVSLSLASEENYIDDLEDQLLDYEIKHKYINFAEIRINPDKYPEHKEYTDILSKLKSRGTYLISNYAIYSPYQNEYSKIFNFDYMRKNIKADIYPLEEYIVISLSEFDKEYNSHDDMKAVGADGAATFFSTVSHDLKRHTKIFCDYQLKDQVPLRIRGNAEYFIHIEKRKKKYPFLLLMYYAPFKLLYKLSNRLIKRYESKKTKLNKQTTRLGIMEYKRNDYSLIYAILRNMSYKLNNICNYFERYAFF